MLRPNRSTSFVSIVSQSVADGDAVDQAASDQRGAERRGAVRGDADAVRPVVHEVAEGAVVAGRRESALGDDQHVRAEPGDLVEHVARHEHALAVVGQAVEQPDHPVALHRVEAGERFVEDQQRRDR